VKSQQQRNHNNNEITTRPVFSSAEIERFEIAAPTQRSTIILTFEHSNVLPDPSFSFQLTWSSTNACYKPISCRINDFKMLWFGSRGIKATGQLNQ
jgi:hypothetical protein